MPVGKPYTTLVTAEQLVNIIDRCCVLDCRASLADADYGARAWAAGHLPGARYADLATDLAAPPGAGGRHPLPGREALAARLRTWGLGRGMQLVTYDDAGGAFAARAWWLARWLGHAASAVLDGGFRAWPGPLETGAADRPPGDFEATVPLTRTADAEEVLAIARGATRRALVDARAVARFRGLEEPIDPVAGHIPGAVCRPFQDNLDAEGRFLPPTRLAERFAGLEDPVCYCGSGVTAAHDVLAIRHAGLGEATLYPGSWSEWIRDPDRPVAR